MCLLTRYVIHSSKRTNIFKCPLLFKACGINFSTSSKCSLKFSQHLNQMNKREYSRKAKGFWFGTKNKTFEVVAPEDVGSKRNVPNYIKKPSYADSGVELEYDDNIKILDLESVECMRKSCSLARIVLNEVARFIEVGVTTDELDAVAHSTCINYGAYPSPLNYRGFPKSICTSVNNIACHGIPDSRRLKDGDIISVDVSVFYNGFHGDCASTYCVGNVDVSGKKLVETAALCLQKGIEICYHGQHFHMIGKTISKLAKERGCSVIPAFCGHGIGSKFHCPPSILHYDNDEKGQMMEGMIFTIEPVISEGLPDIVILEDGWTATSEDSSRSAQFEHTIFITKNGAEILTVPGAFKVDDSSL